MRVRELSGSNSPYAPCFIEVILAPCPLNLGKLTLPTIWRFVNSQGGGDPFRARLAWSQTVAYSVGRLYSKVSTNSDEVIPTARCTKMNFPESCEVSVIVRKTKPGPPESESLTEQVPAAKSAAVPAHHSRFVPGVWFSNENFNVVVVVAVTGAPVTRYLPLEPTIPVMVVEARAFLVETAKIPNPTIRSPSNAR